MASNYATFDVVKRNSDGTVTPLPNLTIYIYDATNNASLGTVESDDQGIIVGGTVDVAVGTKIIFSVQNYFGLANSVTQITT